MIRQILLPILIFMVVTAFLVAVGYFLYDQLFETPLPGAAPVAATAPSSPNLPPPTPPPPPPVEVPPLGASDGFVREVARQVFAHPKAATWFVPEDLVRRFVAIVDNVAQDVSPRPHLGHVAPEESFEVSWSDGDLRLDARSYQRYETLVEVFSSMDTARAVQLYRELEPLLDEAYRELGYPSGSFGPALDRAIDRVIATPTVEGDVKLKRRVSSFKFADPGLEELGPVEKHLLRMGPQNLRKVQAKLRLLREVLDNEEP